MRTPHSTLYRYTAEAVSQANKLPVGTVSEQVHKSGMEHGEPLIIAIDCLLKYAEAYRERFEMDLAHDLALGAAWRDALDSIHSLLNGEGVIQMKGKGQSYDASTLDNVYRDALRIAGFNPEDLQ